MRRLTTALALALSLSGAPGMARDVVTASDPYDLSVTVYRDPERSEGDELNADFPGGLAVISEKRRVTLPPGRSTIRFDGVSEGMVAISAIVSGLPGGTIEKNRNADLLSPAALVNGMLGNRVTITRTDPATGAQQSEAATIRTRADGGMVLQTAAGYEAVRCAGVYETLTFDRVPGGLSAQPVFTIDTQDERGGTYDITLTYISWGFDWQANYVATLGDRLLSADGATDLRLLSWLTVANNNGQSFPNAELLAVAGAINITSDFEDLADPPRGGPLRLRCYPLGSTKTGVPVPIESVSPPPAPLAAPAPMMMEADVSDTIVVTGARRMRTDLDSPTALAIVAAEEQLGDLKLYRVPERMTVAANGLKQVAFLDRDDVSARFLYVGRCSASHTFDDIKNVYDMEPTELQLTMKNEKARGLGVALPMGGLAVFEPGPNGTQLIGDLDMRDYANGQDIELGIAQSTQVFVECAATKHEPTEDKPRRWTRMRALVSNANDAPAEIRLLLGEAGYWDVRWPKGETTIKDGMIHTQVTVPANSTRSYNWKIRRPKGYYE
ncbi:MAG: hypothetical protein WA908_12975 [Pontixanthobacter sp.]